MMLRGTLVVHGADLEKLAKNANFTKGDLMTLFPCLRERLSVDPRDIEFLVMAVRCSKGVRCAGIPVLPLSLWPSPPCLLARRSL